MNKKSFVFIGCLLLIFILAGCSKNITETGAGAEQSLNSSGEQMEEAEAAALPDEVAEEENQAEASVTEVPEETKATQAPEEVIATQAPMEEIEVREGVIEVVDFTSELLSTAIDGSNNVKKLYIYLPAGYSSSTKRYPVVYYFHGFSETPAYVNSAARGLNQYMQEDSEFIFVGVDGRTVGNSGSFFSNSPVTGPWEDYVIQEIIPYVDENYRTIATAEARGAAGFSMGAYAALNLTLRHPDVFSAVLSLCPGVLINEQLDVAMKSWKYDNNFLKAYGQAFAPNPDNDTLCDIPTLDGSVEDNAICEKWLAGFGYWDVKLDNYLAKNQPLNKIEIMYGTADMYTWITEGSKYLSEIMTEKGIEHTLIELKAGHSIPSNYIQNYLIPFFTDGLKFTE